MSTGAAESNFHRTRESAAFGNAPNEISNNTRAIFCSQNSALAFGVAQTTIGNTFADLLVSGCNSSGP